MNHSIAFRLLYLWINFVILSTPACRSREASELQAVSDANGWSLGLSRFVDGDFGTYEGYGLVLCNARNAPNLARGIVDAVEFGRSCVSPFLQFNESTQKYEPARFIKIPGNLMQKKILEKQTNETNIAEEKIQNQEVILTTAKNAVYAKQRELSRLEAQKVDAEEAAKPPSDPTKPRVIPAKPIVAPDPKLFEEVNAAILVAKETVEKEEATQKKLEQEKSAITYHSVLATFGKSEQDLAQKFPSIYSGKWEKAFEETVHSVPELMLLISSVYEWHFSCRLGEVFEEFKDEQFSPARCKKSQVSEPFDSTQLVGESPYLLPGTYSHPTLGQLKIAPVNQEKKSQKIALTAITLADQNINMGVIAEYLCSPQKGICTSVKPNGLFLVMNTKSSFSFYNTDGSKFDYKRDPGLIEGIYSYQTKGKDDQWTETAKVALYLNKSNMIFEFLNKDQGEVAYEFKKRDNVNIFVSGKASIIMIDDETFDYTLDASRNRMTYNSDLTPTLMTSKYRPPGSFKVSEAFVLIKVTATGLAPYRFTIHDSRNAKTEPILFECKGSLCQSEDGKNKIRMNSETLRRQKSFIWQNDKFSRSYEVTAYE